MFATLNPTALNLTNSSLVDPGFRSDDWSELTRQMLRGEAFPVSSWLSLFSWSLNRDSLMAPSACILGFQGQYRLEIVKTSSDEHSVDRALRPMIYNTDSEMFVP